jgi:hypothetical protein
MNFVLENSIVDKYNTVFCLLSTQLLKYVVTVVHGCNGMVQPQVANGGYGL